MAEDGAPRADLQVSPADFIVGGEPAGDIQVRISYGIIDRFSEGLYSSSNKAFEELISNSYDAGATQVWVSVPDDLDAEGALLAVVDDGVSMDLEGLRDLWQVGVSNKRDDDAVAHANRKPIGKFGIGKLATYVLAHKLTYLCKADGAIRAVTMDYGKATGEMSDPVPMSLEVIDLTETDARSTLDAVFGPDASIVETLFADDGPSSWTVAVLSDLKHRALGIQQRRLRWILRAALPLGDHFRLWFNGEEIQSTKVDATPPWEFTVGESDADLEDWPYGEMVTTDDQGRPGVQLPAAGFIRGVAQLYDISLKGGVSDARGRSHGFFVKVRERLINLDDETFGVEVELSHGVLTRFRMEIDADGLDEHIASPRESIQESPALEEVRDYLLSVFNRARSWRARQEEATDKDLLASSERISAPPAALSTGPLRRVLQRAIDGDDEIGQLLRLESDDLARAGTAIDAGDTLLQQVLIEPLGHEKPLVQYSPEHHAAVVNSDHPFVNNYVDVHGAAEPLRLVGVSELLTQVYMIDEDLDPRLVARILDRRDEFLRALVNIHPRSAAVVARQLRDAKGLEKELEDAVADALEVVGFDVTRLSNAKRPDGIARASLGARQEGGGSRNYSVTYDSKSSKHDAIKAATAGTQTLRKHRKEYDADHSLLVAPGFQGSEDEESAIVENCGTDEITPLTVDQLAEIVELFPFRSITPETLTGLFALHTPAEVGTWLDALKSAAPPTPPPIREILDLVVELSAGKDAVTVQALAATLKVQQQIDWEVGPLRGLLRGLGALAVDSIWFEDDQIALNAGVANVMQELRQCVEPLSDEVAGLFKEALAEPGDQ